MDKKKEKTIFPVNPTGILKDNIHTILYRKLLIFIIYKKKKLSTKILTEDSLKETILNCLILIIKISIYKMLYLYIKSHQKNNITSPPYTNHLA